MTNKNKTFSKLFYINVTLVVCLIGICTGAFFYYNESSSAPNVTPAIVVIPEQVPAPSFKDDTISKSESDVQVDEVTDIIELLDTNEGDHIKENNEIKNSDIDTPEEDTRSSELEIEEKMSETEENSVAAPDNPEDIPENSVAVESDKPTQKIILNKLEKKVPMLAIVIDDMGISPLHTKEIISLKAPLTSSFLTYGKNLNALAESARQSGHEIMLHAPMEPKVPANLAPDTIKASMDKKEIEGLFASMLDKFSDIKVNGINNHMGSRFTEDKEKFGYVMAMLKEKNMYFLDSKTTAMSKGKELALENNIDYIARDVFLDNENEYNKITAQIAQAEKIAKRKGFAVAICHPKSQTYLALKDWLANRNNNDIQLVHLSEIVKAINQYQ